MEAESDEWTWTALAAEEGKERATELYQRSGGSLGRALALAQNDRNDPLKEVMGVPEVPLGWRVLADRVGGEPAAELYVRTGGSLQAALEANPLCVKGLDGGFLSARLDAGVRLALAV